MLISCFERLPSCLVVTHPACSFLGNVTANTGRTIEQGCKPCSIAQPEKHKCKHSCRQDILGHCSGTPERQTRQVVASVAERRHAGRLTRVGVVTPAEDTLIGTSQGGGSFHAAVRLNAIEAVLIAASPAPQHSLGPPAQLDPTVRPCRHTPGRQSSHCHHS